MYMLAHLPVYMFARHACAPYLRQHACHACDCVPHDWPSSALCAVTANLFMVEESNRPHSMLIGQSIRRCNRVNEGLQGTQQATVTSSSRMLTSGPPPCPPLLAIAQVPSTAAQSNVCSSTLTQHAVNTSSRMPSCTWCAACRPASSRGFAPLVLCSSCPGCPACQHRGTPPVRHPAHQAAHHTG